MMRSRLGLFPLILALLGLSILPACGGPDLPPPGTLRVGVVLPMSGAQATYGEESNNGLRMALADLNEEELPMVEVNGKKQRLKLDVVLRDEVSRKQDAQTQAKSLIEGSGAHVILGSVASSNTKGIFQVCRESEVPCITPASTNDTLTTEGGPFTSRICFKDSFQGAVLARFAIGQDWKTASLVIDKAQDYSVGLAKNFKQAFKAAGGTVTEHFYVTEDADFSNVVQNVANDAPDVILIAGYYAQAGPMIKQAKGKWDGKPILGGDGLDSPELVGLVGDTKAEIYLSSHFAADAPDERVQSFAKRYKDKHGKSPGAMAALGYDVVLVLVDAVKRAKDPFDKAELAQAIAATKGVSGITGTISLDNDERTPLKDAVIVKVDGGFKYHKTIKAGE